jgi:hypothetical protein
LEGIWSYKSLKVNKNTRILPDDKGNCLAVLDETMYKDKLHMVLESRAYEILLCDPTTKTGGEKTTIVV